MVSWSLGEEEMVELGRMVSPLNPGGGRDGGTGYDEWSPGAWSGFKSTDLESSSKSHQTENWRLIIDISHAVVGARVVKSLTM